MSHFSRIRTAFRDRELLIQCLREAGYQVQDGGVVRGYQGEKQVDFVVSGKGGYGIGFVKNADGVFDVVTDSWGVAGEEKKILEFLQLHYPRISRDYAKRLVMDQTAREGYSLVSEEEQEDGSVRIVVRRWV